MRAALRLFCVSGLVLGTATAAFADKGDLFLSLAPVIDAAKPSAPAFGGSASFQMGVNEATDFMLEGSATFATGSDDETTRETRLLLGSLYTPYFGDIRPRFGGSGGLVHVDAPEGVDEVYLNLGFHLQGLYDASDRIRLFAEAHPNFTFGKHGEFSTLMKVGLLFRLSK